MTNLTTPAKQQITHPEESLSDSRQAFGQEYVQRKTVKGGEILYEICIIERSKPLSYRFIVSARWFKTMHFQCKALSYYNFYEVAYSCLIKNARIVLMKMLRISCWNNGLSVQSGSVKRSAA